jgi:hypothetical protein
VATTGDIRSSHLFSEVSKKSETCQDKAFEPRPFQPRAAFLPKAVQAPTQALLGSSFAFEAFMPSSRNLFMRDYRGECCEFTLAVSLGYCTGSRRTVRQSYLRTSDVIIECLGFGLGAMVPPTPRRQPTLKIFHGLYINRSCWSC